MEILRLDKNAVVCVKPAGVSSADGRAGMFFRGDADLRVPAGGGDERYFAVFEGTGERGVYHGAEL